MLIQVKVLFNASFVGKKLLPIMMEGRFDDKVGAPLAVELVLPRYNSKHRDRFFYGSESSFYKVVAW